MSKTDDAARERTIWEIAKRELDIETLATRKSDALDFYDIGVWGLKAALEAAYEAGRAAERKRRMPTRCKCPACGRTVEITQVT